MDHVHWELRICIENDKSKNKKTWGFAFIEYSEDHVFENAKMFPIFAILNSQWLRYFLLTHSRVMIFNKYDFEKCFYCPLDLIFCLGVIQHSWAWQALWILFPMPFSSKNKAKWSEKKTHDVPCYNIKCKWVELTQLRCLSVRTDV